MPEVERCDVLCVAGARPNFPKVGPVLRALAATELVGTLVHTGQHYDDAMSRVFFEQLGLPEPSENLDVGGGSHADVTGRIMQRFEPVLEATRPKVVLVVGDVNSTAACALAASKFHREPFAAFGQTRTRPLVAHVEAGLRSGDRDMPEEINRIVTDAISDVLLVSDPAGLEHLRREGQPDEKLCYVGNVMIDTLLQTRRLADASDVLDRHDLNGRRYALVTLHRPSNVDDPAQLRDVIDTIDAAAKKHDLGIVFPAHPRTTRRLAAAGIELSGRWLTLPPAGYLDFVKLMSAATLILSDSGGIQEEATVLGVRCVTLREQTERPCTLTDGTNVLGGSRPKTIAPAVERAMALDPEGRRPRYWDGRSGERVAAALVAALAGDPMQAAADKVEA